MASKGSRKKNKIEEEENSSASDSENGKSSNESGSGSDSGSESDSGSDSDSSSGTDAVPSDSEDEQTEEVEKEKDSKIKKEHSPSKVKVSPQKGSSKKEKSVKEKDNSDIKKEKVEEKEAKEDTKDNVKEENENEKIKDENGNKEDENTVKQDNDGEIDMSNLTEIEKEQIALEEYEKEARRTRENDLKKKMEAYKHEDDGPSTRGSRSRRSQADKRKEALSDLKRKKEGYSQLSRLEDDEDGSDYDQPSGISKERMEIREKRRQLKQQGSINRKDDDDALGNDGNKSKQDEEDDEEDTSDPVNYSQARFYMQRRRQFFEKHYFDPFFSELVKGNYVRMVIGTSEETGEPTYRFCEVIRLDKKVKEYNFMGERSRVGLFVRIGASSRAFPIASVSNHTISQEEFTFWKSKMAMANRPIPTHTFVKKFRADNDRIVKNYTFTNKDVNAIVQRKKEAGQVRVKLGAERVRLERQLKAAEHAQDFDAAVKISAQLEGVKQKNEQRTTQKTAAVERLNAINDKNRRLNQEKDLQASILNKKMRESMSTAERLQYIRSKANSMFMSKDAIEKFIKEGKLVRQEDGTITTVDKDNIIETIPEDLKPSDQVSPTKEAAISRTISAAINARAVTSTQNFSKKATNEVVFMDRQPANKEDLANVTIKLMEDDGTETILRPVNEIMKKNQHNSNGSKDGTQTKRRRTGLSLKDYYARATQQ